MRSRRTRLAPEDAEIDVRRRYLPWTAVLETCFETRTGAVTVNVAATPTVTVDAPALTNDTTPTFSGTSPGMTPAMIIISTAPTPLPVW
mgnify:CR=1 FL=1